MKKQKLAHRRKDKSLKYIMDGIPPKAFRRYLNKKLRAKNKCILRSSVVELEQKIFCPCKKDLHYHYW